MAPGSLQASPQLKAYADRIGPALDRMSYYQLLNVSPKADFPTIKASFYKAASELHPDRHQALSDVSLREKLETIYARICEGYRVLTSPEKRVAYDKGLLQGKFRFEQKERESKGPKSPEDAIVHPEAKKFFRLAMIGVGKKDWKSAVMNFGFARAYEPKSTLIAEKLAEAQAALKASAPPGGGATKKGP